MNIKEVPELDNDTRCYMASEIIHDWNNHPEGKDRIRWNNLAVAMLLKRITELEQQTAGATP